MHEVIVGVEDGAIIWIDGCDAICQLMHTCLAKDDAICVAQSGHEGVVPEGHVLCSKTLCHAC